MYHDESSEILLFLQLLVSAACKAPAVSDTAFEAFKDSWSACSGRRDSNQLLMYDTTSGRATEWTITT